MGVRGWDLSAEVVCWVSKVVQGSKQLRHLKNADPKPNPQPPALTGGAGP